MGGDKKRWKKRIKNNCQKKKSWNNYGTVPQRVGLHVSGTYALFSVMFISGGVEI